MRFLIDECLTAELVLVAAEAGYEAHHIAHFGKSGWQDWQVAQYACAQDFVLVTNNGGDFEALYLERPLHPGLVILIPNVNRSLQRKLFAGALGQLARRGEPINQVLEVNLDGEDVTFDFYELPPPA